MPKHPAPLSWRRLCLALGLLALQTLAPATTWAEEGLEAPPAPLTLEGDVMVPVIEALPKPAPQTTEGLEPEQAPSIGESEPGEPVMPVPSVIHAPPEPLAPPPLESLTIMLDWYPSLHHAALILAASNGLPQREGLELEIRTPADPGAPLRLLDARLIDLALTHQLQLHLQVDRGKAPLRVATLVDTPLTGVVTRESADVEGPESFAGLSLGHATDVARDILLPALVDPQGIATDEVQLVETGFALATAMTEQALDGLVTPLRLTLPRQLANRGVANRLLKVEEYGIPHHDGLILVAHRDQLPRLREPINELLDILRETTLWMIEHPDAAWEALIEQEPTLDTSVNRASWNATLLRMSAQPAALDSGRYRRVEAYLHENGLIDTISPLERLAVDPGAG
ncbi:MULTISPECIES: ABC transporter substrate-binding protein [unclassified Halomonas]|uniref:ABC transporter substrate-binding protein n=1 Tax=unclassified Halomonas TaxID=2609666 RepID=UPI0028878109|nr:MULTISPECIES: ABC transporter substrate-binding protein [unclassified Halomonas]MDT0499876.1 ABC transporter substrate-binding protein [Halomonas sp. PAR7]MDT0510307.1 ABC transporter substrate-binding protein [Halomonas sp. LES1]MDT0589984.1 ABC transporter substrate-binding protein [Halomonas sp. PAR8]